MESILDFDKELDLAFLDKVVTSFYHGSGPDVRSIAEGKPRRRELTLCSTNLRSAFLRSFKSILMRGPEQMPY